jgi:8-oxo-dGTP pyrophosphatase MutT (NUDIX family)
VGIQGCPDGGVLDWPRLPSLLDDLKRRAFWIVARVCFQLYRWFPIFGSLRSSVAIVHQGKKIIVVERNDGRGLSLPGGVSSRGEAEETTMRREVLEETGLTVESAEFQMRYHSTAEVPCHISVFTAKASGELKASWEGTPRWATVDEIEPRLMKSQRPILPLLRKITDG